MHINLNNLCCHNLETLITNINLQIKKKLRKGLPKSCKDFENRRQVNPTSTVLELLNFFHTFVKLVDIEDIANDNT